MIRMLIVEDSVTQREIFRQIFANDGDFKIVAEAATGQQALEMVQKHSPDVVLMDIHMPGMDGIEATRQIMSLCPVPIVIASATLRRQEVDLAMKALQAGAVSVIEKPQGAVLLHLQKMAPQLREELLAASTARIHRRPATKATVRTATLVSEPTAKVEVIGLCASTGGPPVLLEILGALPKPFPLPILLVQHISDAFVEGFARWLEDSSGQRVRMAASQMRLEPGVWMSPGGSHLALSSRLRLELVERQASDIHCPSGNVLFESLAQHAGSAALGILMTGMGDDGARGLAALRKSGGKTIIQNEASCLIWGMPKAAKDLGAACHELSLADIVSTMKRASM